MWLTAGTGVAATVGGVDKAQAGVGATASSADDVER